MDLIAQGNHSEQRWRRRVPIGITFVLGRTAAGWSASWDEHISRKHAQLFLRGDSLEINRFESARNPIYIDGREVQRGAIRPGEHFVIGGTTFTLVNSQALVSIREQSPVAQEKYSASYLRGIRYRDADKRIDVISRLPDIIQEASNDKDLFISIINVLLSGIPRCEAVAIVDAHSTQEGSVEVLHWDRSLESLSDFRPSERLIRESVDAGQSVIHLWKEQGDDAAAGMYTQRDGLDWAFCTPLPGRTCQGWALYVAGQSLKDGSEPPPAPADFHDDLKFAESAAAMLGNLRDVKQLERGNAALSQFFSPLVLDVLSVEDPEVVLAPRSAQVTVMFCDLRGFSLHSEKLADDLFGLLDRVSAALGVMTRRILDEAGVVGDFQGDSVMGFWGWPLPQEDAALRACRVALMIQGEAEKARDDPNHPYASFGFGIGIATGAAVAGKIGTVDQFKVTVFGPVVNLAARLEGITKIMRTPILIDEATRTLVAENLSPEMGRIRHLGEVQPYGLKNRVSVSELLLPASLHPAVNDRQLSIVEDCIQALARGEGELAGNRLQELSDADAIKGYLSSLMKEWSAHEDWDGVIRFRSK